VKLRDVVVRVCCEEEDPLHTIEHSEYRMHEADGTQTLAGGLDGFGYAATHRDQRRHAVGRRRESAGRLTESGWRRNSVEHLLDDLRVTKTCHVDHRQGLVDVLEAAKGGAIRQDDVFHGLGRRAFLPRRTHEPAVGAKSIEEGEECLGGLKEPSDRLLRGNHKVMYSHAGGTTTCLTSAIWRPAIAEASSGVFPR